MALFFGSTLSSSARIRCELFMIEALWPLGTTLYTCLTDSCLFADSQQATSNAELIRARAIGNFGGPKEALYLTHMLDSTCWLLHQEMPTSIYPDMKAMLNPWDWALIKMSYFLWKEIQISFQPFWTWHKMCLFLWIFGEMLPRSGHKITGWVLLEQHCELRLCMRIKRVRVYVRCCNYPLLATLVYSHIIHIKIPKR